MSEKILLINPPYKKKYDPEARGETLSPLGILSIGSLLKKEGVDIRLIDATYEDYEKIIHNEVKNSPINFIGLSVMTSQIPQAIEIAKFIRELDPGIKIVWGGIHPTLFPEQTCDHPLVDIVVVKEGEYTCLDLARALSDGRDLATIPGIVFKNNGEIIKNPERDLLDIETLPFNDFELLDIEKYIYRDFTERGGLEWEEGPIRRSLPLAASVGCPHRCRFCINVILKKKYRMRSALSMVNEIERLIEKYNMNDVYFQDEDFFISKKRFFGFLDLIEKRDLKFTWYANVRANYFGDHYLSLEALKRMRKCGGVNISIGAESGSERVLKKLCKGITPQMTELAAKLTAAAKINVAWSFITCLPFETEEEMQKTYEFSSKLLKINPNSYVIGPQPFRPYPGSLIYNEVIEEFNIQMPVNLDEWSEEYQNEEGFFALEKLPWIKNPQRKRLQLLYLALIQYRNDRKISKNPIIKKIIQLLQFIGEYRSRNQFYFAPFEYYLYKLYLFYKKKR